MYFLGLKNKSAICDWTPPTYTSNQVYMCRGGLKQNSIISIHLTFYKVFKILASLAPGGGTGGWGDM